MKRYVPYVLTSSALIATGLVLGWLIFGGSRHEGEHAHPVSGTESEIWTCSMHPQIRQEQPGDCPICGMDLIPLGTGSSASTADPLAIAMTPEAMQLAGVRTARVGRPEGRKEIAVNGQVREDERLLYSQSAHIPGRVERLGVNFTGEQVKRGQVIAELYSPELITAAQELREAYALREQQPDLYLAAREKLRNWRRSESQIDAILRSGNTGARLPIQADHSGYVVEKMVNPGDYVRQGQELFRLADLSRVWILFDIYENDLAWVGVGDTIAFTIAGLPGREWNAPIEYIDPVIDPQTRTAQARVVLNNTEQILKPGVLARGAIQAQIETRGDQLSVPRSAVLWTGKRSLVYVRGEDPSGVSFRMREVVLGPAMGDTYIVEEGLEPGEEIAVSGAFSIDAAAQLSGKPSMMEPGADIAVPRQKGHVSQGSAEAAMPAGSQAEQEGSTSPATSSELNSIFEAYLKIKDALVASDRQRAKREGERLLKFMESLPSASASGNTEWSNQRKALLETTQALVQSDDLAALREHFSELSDRLYHSLKTFDSDIRGYRQFCPMSFDNQGAYWLSDSEEVLNPYFGAAMLRCGSVEERLYSR